MTYMLCASISCWIWIASFPALQHCIRKIGVCMSKYWHCVFYCNVWLESNLHCTKNRWAWSQLCGSHVLCMLVLIVIAIYILHNVQGFISAMFICTCTVLVALASTIIILLCSKVTSIYHGGCMVLPWSIPCNVEKLDVAPIGRRLYNVENA